MVRVNAGCKGCVKPSSPLLTSDSKRVKSSSQHFFLMLLVPQSSVCLLIVAVSLEVQCEW